MISGSFTLKLALAGGLIVTSAWARPAHAQDFAALGKALVEEMVAGQFARVEARYGPFMGREYPAGRLSKVWEDTLRQSGAFQAIIATEHKTAGGSDWALVTCEFEKVTRNVEIGFDPDQRIGLLLIKPVAQWSPPYYVDQKAFHEREVTVGSGHWKMPGTLSIPNGRGQFPAVLLVQGLGLQDEDLTIGANKLFKDLAWGLASRKVAVLRYTKRTVKYAKEIDESQPGFTVQELIVDDARAAVASLATQPEIDAKRVYVLGHGVGGMLAPRIAAGTPVAGIVIMAGNSTPIEEGIVRQVKYLAEIGAGVAEGVDGEPVDGGPIQVREAEQMAREIESPSLTASTKVSALGAQTPGSFWLDLCNYGPAHAAARLKIPVLVLQAARDYQVTSEDFLGWKKGLAGNPKASFQLYPGLFHLFLPSLAPGDGLGLPNDYSTSSHLPEIVITDLVNWITEQNEIRTVCKTYRARSFEAR